ncbi:MAG: Conserved repeat domain protein, partial [uncultured Sulfurovum sp.]
MDLIRILLIFIVTFLNIAYAATVNGTTYKIDKVKYTINGNSYTQTSSGTAPTSIDDATPVYIKEVILDNGTVLDNFAINDISVTLHSDFLNLNDSSRSIIYNNNKLSANNANAESALNTTNIKDYLVNDDDNNERLIMDIQYNGYHFTASNYIFYHERHGNNSFKIQALDKNGNPTGNILIFPKTDSLPNGWDPGFRIGGPLSSDQHPWMGVIKADQFGVSKIYGLRQWATGADLKFYVLGEESFGEEPTMSIANETITEGDSGTQNLNFTVSLDKATTGSLTFDYQVFAGSNVDSTLNATTPSDYTSTGTVVPASFNINSQTYTISIPINGDTKIEEDETFTIVFSNVQGATIANNTATGTILNDDSSTELKSCGLVATSIMPSGNRNDSGNGASVVAFDYSERGTINDIPAPMELASAKEVGTVWGKAYNGSTKKLYASSFLRRHADLSPDGLGAIYEIDVNTKTPTLWMNLNSKTHLGSS